MQIFSNVIVCVEQIENGSLSGEIWFPYEENAVSFYSTIDMFLKINYMFDRVERVFEENHKVYQYHSYKDYSGFRRKKIMFLLRIISRQYETMQGTFFNGTFLKKPVPFRSTVELGYYIHELVQMMEKESDLKIQNQ